MANFTSERMHVIQIQLLIIFNIGYLDFSVSLLRGIMISPVELTKYVINTISFHESLFRKSSSILEFF